MTKHFVVVLRTDEPMSRDELKEALDARLRFIDVTSITSVSGNEGGATTNYTAKEVPHAR